MKYVYGFFFMHNTDTKAHFQHLAKITHTNTRTRTLVPAACLYLHINSTCSQCSGPPCNPKPKSGYQIIDQNVHALDRQRRQRQRSLEIRCKYQITIRRGSFQLHTRVARSCILSFFLSRAFPAMIHMIRVNCPYSPNSPGKFRCASTTSGSISQHSSG